MLLGNHRDSWAYGAMDAVSGTASMLEVARSFSRLYESGWRPRRTLLFCSWDGEEFGTLGSTEWVEHHHQVLRSKVAMAIQ